MTTPASNATPSQHRFKDGLGYKVSRAAKVMQQAGDSVLKPLGLTRLSWTVLASIGFDGITMPGAIARHIGIERTAVSRILTQLERDGLIERRANAADGRAYHMALTPDGTQLTNKVPPQLARAMGPLHARLTPEELITLGHMLDRLSHSDAPVWQSDRG